MPIIYECNDLPGLTWSLLNKGPEGAVCDATNDDHCSCSR